MRLNPRVAMLVWPDRLGWTVLAVALIGSALAAAFATVSITRVAAAPVALAIDSGDARANGRLAQTMLEASAPSALVVKVATRALLRDPTVVEAARSLGLAQAQLGRESQADRSMDYAASLSRRDLGTTLWRIERSVGRNDVVGALHLYDTALRTSRGAHQILFPILASTLNDAEFAAPVAKVLSARPVWARNFQEFVMNGETAPADTARLFGAIAASGGHVDDDLSRELVNRLVVSRDFALAWRLYTEMRPGEAASRPAVRDAKIQSTEHPMAFDWQFANTAESAVTPSTRGKPFEFTSFADGPTVIAYQLLLLNPGRYQLGSTAKLGTGRDSNIAWALNCAGSDKNIGTVQFGHSAPTDFAVVPADCPAQWLRLIVASSGGDVVAGSVVSVDLRASSATNDRLGTVANGPRR